MPKVEEGSRAKRAFTILCDLHRWKVSLLFHSGSTKNSLRRNQNGFVYECTSINHTVSLFTVKHFMV
ncbi:hypothetical protein ZEAMMB73_Zm00001d014107 [Zea mays]|uniref:Uncharacterized protein n=1 Tax=Zea mays TaxID=4577 RepID=A0A1D6GPX7_MAIZE|nr:hypothetical protein ZEAMMB73_Zm00001d014107 [Zea mays]